MSIEKNTPEKFNLPSYLHIPAFLYTDPRLKKSATNIAAFFYSICTSGKKITASKEYLCQLGGVKERQLYKIFNLLESCKYIKREGSTSNSKISWIYRPEHAIEVTDGNVSVTDDAAYALQCSKLMHSSAVSLCTPVHTYNKEDTKEIITTTPFSEIEEKPNGSIEPSCCCLDEIIDIYHKELPDNPKVLKVGESLRRQLLSMQKNWKAKYSFNDLPFSLDAFRAYLTFIKQNHAWIISERTLPSGKIGRNGLRTLTRPMNLEKFRNGEF